jgi:hypothetical protein
MGLRCIECEAELIGAVNRCWNCGSEKAPTQVAPTQVADAQVADVQVADGGFVLAEVAFPQPSAHDDVQAEEPFISLDKNNSSSSSVESSQQAAESSQQAVESSQQAGGGAPAGRTATDVPELSSPHTTSPFAPRDDEVFRAIRVPTYRNPYLGNVCSWTALVLGTLAIVVSVGFPIGGVILALIGLTVSAIGMRSHGVRSLLALLLCLAALVTSATVGALNLYVAKYDRYPWQATGMTPDSLPASGEEFDEWE